MAGKIYYRQELQFSGIVSAIRLQRRGQDFSWGEGVVTLCQSEDAHVIVMPLSPPVLGCLLKRALSRYLANL